MRRSVLVTGAASGTGWAIAKRFSAEGFAVFVSSRGEAEAQAAAVGLGDDAFGFRLDPADGELGVKRFFGEIERLGYMLDAVVLNAASLGLGMDALATPLNAWAEVVATNVIWNFSIARAAAMMMRSKGAGSIVFIGSNTCKRAIPERSAYIASKGALLSLSKALAIDLGRHGIRANCVLAGPIKTKRWDALSPDAQAAKIARSPLKRIASFEDIANAAYFLSSAEAANITGAELVIDGGLSAQLGG